MEVGYLMGENRKAMASGGILISILIIATILTFLTTSSFAAAEAEVIVIARGREDAYSVNQTGDKPWKWYKAGDYPPTVAAKKVGGGAVVAAGVASSFEDIETAPEFGRWNDARAGYEPNPLPHLDILLDVAFQWMTPGATKVLWYEGYNVLYSTTNCTNLINALKALGYTITGDSTEPITADLLAPYDILVIPQLQLDPSDAEVEIIKTFVEGGKGLFIAEGSDYRGFNYYKVQNKILSAFESELPLEDQLAFQSDEMKDPVNYWESEDKPIVDVDTTTGIGAAYQAATGEAAIGLYRACTLAPPTLYGVAVSITQTEPPPTDEIENDFRPTLATASPGANIVTVVRVSNIGKENDSYTISVVDDLGWQIEVSLDTLEEVPAGEGSDVTVEITVDPALEDKVRNLVRITAEGTDVEDTIVLATAPLLPVEELPYPIYKEDELFYVFSTPSLLVEPPAQPIIIGTETSCTLEETPYREPYPLPFGQREYPIAAAAQEVEDGRVIVYGPAASFRSAPFNHFVLETLKLKDLGPRMIGWLVNYEDPAQHKVLFFWTPTKLAFHNGARMAAWLEYLGEQGYTVHTYSNGITPERLALYSVFILFTPERALKADEITAIKDWVHAGGGLLLGEQADYGGYAKPLFTNPILEAIGASIESQDDQITDYEQYSRWAWEPRVYLLDHPVWYAPYAFSVGVGPWSQSLVGGEEGVFTLTIKNEGTEADSYRIEVTSELGWEVELEREEITLLSGENAEVRITVTSPGVEELTRDVFTAVASGTRGSDSAEFMLVAEPEKQVTISPSSDSGSLGETLTFTVTVKNTGEAEDTYDLTVDDDAGWDLTLSQYSLANVGSGASRTVTLTVAILSDAAEGDSTEITVRATPRSDPAKSDTATCTVTAKAAAGFPLVYLVVAVVIIVVILGAVLMIKRR